MAEQDDVLHLIDDPEAAPEDSSARKWKIAVIDDDQAVHEGTRFALSDYSLNGQRPGNPVGLFGGRGPHADARQSRHRGRAARRHHGNRRRRPRPRRIYPQRDPERDRPHHPAHRPARPGAGTPRHRPVRHQRLQGEDGADRRQAVHLADRRAAQLPAARAHGADPARARDHHRRGLDAVRLQIDAAARRGRADAARLAAQRRLRRHPGAARRRQRRPATIFPCWPAPAATAASSAPPDPNRSIRICARWWKPPSSAASTNSSTSAPCSMCAPAADARSSCCCRRSANCPRPTARWWRFSAAGSRSRSTTSSFISSCTRPTPSSRTASPSAPAR